VSAVRVERLEESSLSARALGRLRLGESGASGLLALLACAAVVVLSFGVMVVALERNALHAAQLLGISLLAATWIVVMAFAASQLRSSALARSARPAMIAAGVGFIATALVDVWLPAQLSADTGDLMVVAACAIAIAAPSDAFLAKRVARPTRVLLVGGGAAQETLLRDLAARPDLAFRCIGMVTVNGDRPLAAAACLGTVDDLPSVAAWERPDLVIVARGDAEAEAPRRLLNAGNLDCRLMRVDDFYEHVFRCIPVQDLSPAWFMGVLHAYRRPYRRGVKRSLDLLLGSLALALATPVLPVIALLVRLSGPGPILYRQARVGEGGASFEMLKFRTMVDGAEEPGKPVWAAHGDPRVTRIGHYLRKSRLDELPQLLNVLRGDMSFIGPRPERPEFLDLLEREVPFWNRRHLVKPGITGWAQVQRGYTADVVSAAEKLSYDLYYLKHRSVGLDLTIAGKTVRALLSGAVESAGAST
jgi:exopolysaccharide biosynthesis polyprenyl glycosylphosphotransferase